MAQEFGLRVEFLTPKSDFQDVYGCRLNGSAFFEVLQGLIESLIGSSKQVKKSRRLNLKHGNIYDQSLLL